MNEESSDLVGQRKIRIEKVNKLRELGFDPYPAKANRTHLARDIKENFDNLENETVTVAGRLMSWREHGALIFGDLQDQSGSVQLYIRQDEIAETNVGTGNLGFDNLNLADIGDIIEAKGYVTKTQRGEVSIAPAEIRMLTKAIRPLPTEIEDKEERYRRRYLDLTLHEEVRKRFIRRSKFWEAIRNFLNDKGFLEINIPVLEHVTGGADAKPFETFYDALGQTFYLRISHELPLKRLLGGGYDKVYDIGPRFRNEGLSDEHLPEHVAMEWYWAYADWKDGIELTKEMYRHVMKEVYGTLQFEMKGFSIDLEKEWEIIDYTTIIKERFGVDIFNTSLEEMNTILKNNGVDLGEDINKNRVVDNLWKLIRKTIAGPAFLTGVPKFLSPLAKIDYENQALTQRFHPVIAGSELANAFGELNDPQDQLDRFLDQKNLRDSGDSEAHMLDIDFVEMLEYGMPPAVGFGLSERVFWFFEDVTAKEGVIFPQLKHTISDVTKKVYPDISFEVKSTSKASNSLDLSSDESIIFTDETNLPSIDEANILLEKNVSENDYHMLHAKMVATAMKAYAEKLNANENLWYLTGLLHDLDYTKNPEEHPNLEMSWFREWGYPEVMIHAIGAHDHEKTGINPQNIIDKVLIASDEMSGLLYAYAIMRPEKFEGMKVKSVLKKFEDKNFAPKIDRKEITKGVKLASLDLNEHIELLINVFKGMEEFK